MTDKNTKNQSRTQNITDAIKNWMMVGLTLIFVFLYAATLFGWIKPPTDTVIMRIEPIIFIIVGYYLGRIPARQNEQTLKDEISRQTQKADAAQHAKEQAQQEREILEEKIKNVKITLTASTSHTSYESLSEKKLSTEAIRSSGSNRVQNSVISAAINILNS